MAYSKVSSLSLPPLNFRREERIEYLPFKGASASLIRYQFLNGSADRYLYFLVVVRHILGTKVVARFLPRKISHKHYACADRESDEDLWYLSDARWVLCDEPFLRSAQQVAPSTQLTIDDCGEKLPWEIPPLSAICVGNTSLFVNAGNDYQSDLTISWKTEREMKVSINQVRPQQHPYLIGLLSPSSTVTYAKLCRIVSF